MATRSSYTPPRIDAKDSAMIRKLKKPHAKKRAHAARRTRNGANGRTAAQSTRERILGSAARLFAEHGFEGSSMPAIAKASGITAGAIYKHFRSKGELLLEVVRRSFESTPLFIQNGTSGTAAALPLLASLYTEPDLKLVRQLSIEVHSAASKDAEIRKLLARSNAVLIQHVRDTITMALREGQIETELNPDFAAR